MRAKAPNNIVEFRLHMEPNSINDILNSLARLLAENKSGILAANAADLDACPADDAVILDRLKADPGKIDNMITSVRRVMDAPTAAGTVISSHVRADGLRIENRRVPFGTILIIYEARPDVTIEAASIALKAGNRILLKGGRKAQEHKSFSCFALGKSLGGKRRGNKDRALSGPLSGRNAETYLRRRRKVRPRYSAWRRSSYRPRRKKFKGSGHHQRPRQQLSFYRPRSRCRRWQRRSPLMANHV